MDRRWILADVETTGLSATDKVVEVAWMEIDEGFNILGQGVSLIDPGIPIPAVTSAVHGITNRDVVGAPDMDSYMATTGLNHGNVVLVAHNSAFDFKFLGRYLPEGAEQLCTVRLARKLWPDVDNHKLGTLVYALELEVDKGRFHSADGDMAVLMALLGKAHEDFGMTFEDMLAIGQPEPKLPLTTESLFPFGKHKALKIKDVPRSYVKWALGLDNLDDELRVVLQSL